VHVPPQPLSAPPHLLVQSGVQLWHWRLALQVSVALGQHPLAGQLLPEGQTQVPSWQSSPVRQISHVAPLLPQALVLVPRLHVVPSQHPVGQLVLSQTHCPCWQRWPAVQAVAQLPQCCWLVCRSAQPSPQKTVLPGQPVQTPGVPRHWPLQHCVGLSQEAPSPLQVQRALPSLPTVLKRLQHLAQEGRCWRPWWWP